MKTILITWWLWYIGSHAVVEFEKNWYKTVIIDNLSNTTIDSLLWIEKILGYKPDFFEIDLRQKTKDKRQKNNVVNYIDWKLIEENFSLDEVFKKYTFDSIVHFAWLKAVWESCSNVLEYHDNNIVWSIRLFELMEKYNCKNIIFSSSATVYKAIKDEHLKINGWYTENDFVWDCSNPYWTTKFVLEQLLRDLAIHSNFNVMNLRYFNPIWAHKSWFIWEDPNWIPNNLLPYIMKVANWELPHLNVFWNDYPTIDWTWVRDYIDVNDLVEWHLLAYSKLDERQKKKEDSKAEINLKWQISGTFETYNLWTGKWVSVLEMLKATEKVIWKEISYKIVWRRGWDLAVIYCNWEKAYKELWFKTKISLEESLKNSWNFINKTKEERLKKKD